MEQGVRNEEVVLVMEEGFVPYPFSSYSCQCRICHEEEEQSCTSMESPCVCSGTVKFAHRGCIQRWCDEKGSTQCEICLQNFEPGYTVVPKEALLDMRTTTRGSLEAPRQNHETSGQNENFSEAAVEHGECSPESTRNVSYCWSIATTLTILLLFRHLISVITLGADYHPLTLLTVFVLRASGILLPFYGIMKAISALQHMQRQCQQQQRSPFSVMDDGLLQEGEEEDQLQQHTVGIDT